MKEVTKTFTVTASSAEVMHRFERLLMLFHVNGNIGHSGRFGMPLDGDGSDRLEVAEFKSKLARGPLPYEIEAINGAAYDIVLALDGSYSGFYKDTNKPCRYKSGPAGHLYKDGEVRHTYPSRDWSHESNKRPKPKKKGKMSDSSPPEWPGPVTVKEGAAFPEDTDDEISPVIWSKPVSHAAPADTNAVAECHALRDIESFCELKIEAGVSIDAYKDVKYLVRKHRKELERGVAGAEEEEAPENSGG